jgi:O-antigen/teichoic acid export membrane protein
MIAFLFYFKQKVLGLLCADIVVTTFSSLFLYLTIRGDIKIKLDFIEAKKMLSYGLPLAPGQIFSSIFDVADRYFLSNYVTLSAVGVYSVGMKLSQAVPMLLSRPFQLIFPAVTYSLHKDSAHIEYCKKIFTYYFLVGIFICLSIAIFSKEILSILGRREYLAVENIIPFLLLSYLFHGVQQNLQIGIFVERKTHWLPIIVGVGCAVNIVLNWALIQGMGIFGCAIAKISAKLLMVLMWYFLSKRVMDITYEWARILKISVAGCLVYAVSRLVTFDALILSIVFKLFLIVLFPVALCVFSFFVPDEMAKIKSIYRRATRASLKLIFSR